MPQTGGQHAAKKKGWHATTAALGICQLLRFILNTFAGRHAAGRDTTADPCVELLVIIMQKAVALYAPLLQVVLKYGIEFPRKAFAQLTLGLP